jgi:hypothetical protein
MQNTVSSGRAVPHCRLKGLVFLAALAMFFAFPGCVARGSRSQGSLSSPSTPQATQEVVTSTVPPYVGGALTSSPQPSPLAPAVTFSPVPEIEQLEATVVELRDGTIVTSRTSFTVGIPYKFRIVNNGSKRHSLELRTQPRSAEGPPVVVFSLGSEGIGPRQTRDVYVSFSLPGPYLLVCPLEEHAREGESLEIGVL